MLVEKMIGFVQQHATHNTRQLGIDLGFKEWKQDGKKTIQLCEVIMEIQE